MLELLQDMEVLFYILQQFLAIKSLNLMLFLEEHIMKQKSRGVITVEAALVMPVILGTLFLLYSLAIVQYNNVVARAEAMRVANRVAMNWNTIGGTGHNILKEDQQATVYHGETAAEGTASRTGKDAIYSACYEEHNPYRFFGELFGAGKTKKENIENYLDEQMEKVNEADTGISLESASSIKSDSNLLLFNRYVSVTINNTYSSPLFEVIENMTGYQVGEKYSVTAKAKLTEPAEFVRNVSFIEELLRNRK